MLLDKIANVTPTVEAEYDPSLVAAVHQAHETKERRAATLAKVHEMLTEAGAPAEGSDGMNAFCSLIWDVESAQGKAEEDWRISARSAVAQQHPSLDLEGLDGFTTPAEFFKALHAAHGSDLGASENDALTHDVASRLGLGTQQYDSRATVSGKTLVSPYFVTVDSYFGDQITHATLSKIADLERFMHTVMGEPFFSFRRDLSGFRSGSCEDFIGQKLAEGHEESIIRHVQLYKNGNARFTFKTTAGLAKFLRAFGAEDRMEQDA